MRVLCEQTRWLFINRSPCSNFHIHQISTLEKTNSCQNSTLSVLMSNPPKQVSLFFAAAHSMSSEVSGFRWFMSSTSVHSTATMRYWMKRTTNAVLGIDKEELVQVALLQIHGGDGAYLSVLLGSLIGVSSVHFCLICSV